MTYKWYVEKRQSHKNKLTAIENDSRIFQRLVTNFWCYAEAATWFFGWRLNEIKDRLKFSRCLLTLGKKDVASLGSWTYFVELLEKDIRQVKKDEHDEDNSSMPFWKLNWTVWFVHDAILLADIFNLPRNLAKVLNFRPILTRSIDSKGLKWEVGCFRK